MLTSPADQARAVIPRWRSLAVVPSSEIVSADRSLKLAPLSIDELASEIALWKREQTVEAAVDLLDTGIVMADPVLARRGAMAIIKGKIEVAPRVLEAAHRALTAPDGPLVNADQLAVFEQNEENVRSTLRLLRRRMNNFPRDGTLPLEMARLYMTLGQNEQAAAMLDRALRLMPGNRAVLRAMSLFYHLVQDHGVALQALWRSETTKYDPWLQSAEVALADVADRGSRFAKLARSNLAGVRELTTARTELALGVATLDLGAGVRQRNVFKFVDAALKNATENALAQAFWISDQTARAFGKRYPDLQLPDRAFEAKANALYEERDYAGSLDEAMMWLRDQPFHPEPATFILGLSSTHLENSAAVIPVADHAVALHPSDWYVQNAALLTYCAAGNLEAAKRCARTLDALSKSEVIEAFAAAGWGMIAYREGDIEVARKHYVRSMELSQAAKRPELKINAFIFHILGEVENCRFDPAEVRKAISLVEDAKKRLPVGVHTDISRTWEAVREKLEARIAVETEVGLGHSRRFLEEAARAYQLLAASSEND